MDATNTIKQAPVEQQVAGATELTIDAPAVRELKPAELLLVGGGHGAFGFF